MLKRFLILLVAALMLCAGFTARAEGGVKVEVIKRDGVSVVVLTPVETVQRAKAIAKSAGPALVLPEALTLIEEEAFEGIAAERVEVSQNVVSIEERAFGDCKGLREIHIPATVVQIDDKALEGCEGVTVYGQKGSEAERFAKAAGFAFVDPDAETETERLDPPSVHEEVPVKLPAVER